MTNYYKQEELWNRKLTIQEAKRINIVKRFIPNHVESILDVGCGNGAISNYLEGFKLIGLDKNITPLKYVKRKVILGNIDNLPFKDNSFDLIICSDVLEHLQEQEYYKSIRELKRVSKQYILIISPNEEDIEANQCKCYKCNTIFHINWHVRKISINDIINNFRDEYVPLYYSFFGEKWTSMPRIKYKMARATDRAYKYWEHALCPICKTNQKGEKEEDLKDIDIKFNKILNGFYNKSTEFIILLSMVEEKKNIFDFDKLNEDNIILSKNKITQLQYVNRQYIDFSEKIFIKSHTERYPQYAYLLDNKENFNCKLVCFPYSISNKEVCIEYRDCLKTSIQINICDLEKGYTPIGVIKFINDNKEKSSKFLLPKRIVPLNEGLVFEIVFDSKHIEFEELNLKKIYIDSNSNNVLDVKLGKCKFLNNTYYMYKYNNFLQKNGEFLLLEKYSLIYDKKYKCFYLNLHDVFEFFNNNLFVIPNGSFVIPNDIIYSDNKLIFAYKTKESINKTEEFNKLKFILLKNRVFYNKTITQFKNKLYKLNVELENIKKEVYKIKLSSVQQDKEYSKICKDIKDKSKNNEKNINKLNIELNYLKKDLYSLKECIYTVSNNLDNFIYKLKNPFKILLHKTINLCYRRKRIRKNPRSKHLLVITPDVKIDRRTIQMCQSIIKEYNISCTIIAAFKDKDDFITNKLKVKRISPNLSKKYKLKLNEWRDGTDINLEEFYWLHFYYLYSAMQEEADYIMCCDLPVLPAGVYVSKIKNIPLIYDAHELYPEQCIFGKDKRDFYTQVEKEFITYPQLVITVNESIAKEMSKRYNIKMPRVILNAIDPPSNFDVTKKYNHFRKKLSIADDQKIVLFQGAYSLNRNLEVLIKSAKYIDSKIVIVLMGFGNYEKELRRLAQKDNTLNVKVFFLPGVNLSVLLEYSASADVGIIPYPHTDLNSYYCTPNKLFEFIQAGLPIIANDSPELNKFIINNKIGFTRKIENEYDIAKMINLFFRQDIDYKSNILKIRGKISWSVEEKKFIHIMKDVFI